MMTMLIRLNILLIGLLVFIGSCNNNEPAPVNCDESDLAIVIGSIGDASSCSSSDGFIKTMVTGGMEPYQFSIDGQASQTFNEFNTMKAGIYTVRVTDANMCFKEVNNVTILAAGFSTSVDVTADNECLDGDGTITINIAEGVAPFLYKLGGGDFISENVFTGLQKGNHAITIKDNNNCTLNLNVTVPRGFTGTSWANEISPIVKVNCAKSLCHDGTGQADLRLYVNAKKFAADIKKFTQDKSMPRDGSLTQAQIDLIACWVDDGALEN